MNRNPRHHCLRGFTIVELLVVVLIVVALSAITLALIRKSMVSGRMAASSANIRQLALANITYLSEHGTYCPAMDRRNLVRWHGARTSRRGAFEPAEGFLSPYLGKSREVGLCPEFERLVDDPSSWEKGSGGYGYNATYIGGTYENPYRPNRPGNVNRPSRTLMFATSALAKGSGLQEYPFAEPRQWEDPNGRLSGSLQPSVHFRFNGKALIAWCDGSVTAESMSESSDLNYYGGDNLKHQIGFPGPNTENGWWNPDL